MPDDSVSSEVMQNSATNVSVLSVTKYKQTHGQEARKVAIVKYTWLRFTGNSEGEGRGGPTVSNQYCLLISLADYGWIHLALNLKVEIFNHLHCLSTNCISVKMNKQHCHWATEYLSEIKDSTYCKMDFVFLSIVPARCIKV